MQGSISGRSSPVATKKEDMSPISLVPANKTTPEELKEMAEELRELADRIENGEILAVAWVATRSAGDEFDRGWVKTENITLVELTGSLFNLMQRMNMELEPED